MNASFNSYIDGVHAAAYKEQIDALSSVAITSRDVANISIGDYLTGGTVVSVSQETFSILGLSPNLGRPFLEREYLPHSNNSVILS
jgi:hypothetical protein